MIKKRHEKKLQNLRREKRSMDGTRPNPNKIIINLTNTKLTNEQYCALQYGLKYGIATQPKIQTSLHLLRMFGNKSIRMVGLRIVSLKLNEQRIPYGPLYSISSVLTMLA